jgi:hypothetical protein
MRKLKNIRWRSSQLINVSEKNREFIGSLYETGRTLTNEEVNQVREILMDYRILSLQLDREIDAYEQRHDRWKFWRK